MSFLHGIKSPKSLTAIKDPMATTTIPTTSANSQSEVLQINVSNQLPLKLNSSNFPSWFLQFETLFTGLDLIGFIDGSKPCPPSTITTQDKVIVNNDYTQWIRQDKLILHAIVASITELVIPLIATSKSSHEAMSKLTNIFASRTRSRIMSLKKKLSLATQGNKSVVEYLQSMRSIADELALAQALVADDDLIIFILNGLGMEFREISTAIRARESAISLEELHDKLTDFESVIKHEEIVVAPALTANLVRKGQGSNFQKQKSYNFRGTENGFQGNSFYNSSKTQYYPAKKKFIPYNTSTNGNRPTCQLCGKFGHSAKVCRNYKISSVQEPVANFAQFSDTVGAQNWMMDSGASHHITTDLNNLSLYSDYGGPDELLVGDGSGLQIKHTGSSKITTS